jgi:hypothetical protein
MAIHENSAQLSADAVDEYIELARIGIAYRKPDAGCLGYASTLLLFCAIDAISGHLGFDPHSFGALNDPLFGLQLDGDQIESLKVWYRHALAHNGMIGPGAILTPEPTGAPIELVNGEPLVIRVIPLHQLVERAWNALDKTTLKARRNKPPKTEIDFSKGSIAFPVASSGCPTVLKITKM